MAKTLAAKQIVLFLRAITAVTFCLCAYLKIPNKAYCMNNVVGVIITSSVQMLDVFRFSKLSFCHTTSVSRKRTLGGLVAGLRFV